MPDYRSSSPLSFSTLPQFPLLIPAPRNSPFSSLQARLSPSTAALRDHTGSPLCWRGDNEYVGDCDDALDHVRAAYMSGGGRPAQRKAAVDFSAAAAASAYDYDLVVIGGGSGGLAGDGVRRARRQRVPAPRRRDKAGCAQRRRRWW